MFNFRKIRKNVKAISPVISVLLMIAVAVVASLVAYSWVMGYIGFQTAKTGQAIQIQSMSNSTGTSAGHLVLYVQNVGDSAVKLNKDSVYVDGALYTTNITGSIDLLPQTTTTIVTNFDGLQTGEDGALSVTLTAKVTTEGGTFSEVTKAFP
jgi:flagellin-like protein